MLGLERRNIIIERLNQEGKIVVSSLSREFNVTEETIRRDIDKIALDGFAIKTYGGAVSNVSKTNFDLPYTLRKKSNIELKQKIADKVVSMIKDGDRIMLDASTTSIYIAKMMKIKEHITVITNSVEILFELADKKGWHVYSTGGSLREGAYSLSGSAAKKMIEEHHVDIAICSAKGIDADLGITESNEADCEIKRAIFNSASLKILCLDSTKFDVRSFTRVCQISDIDVLVTDQEPTSTWKKRFEENGVELRVYGGKDEDISN